MKADDIAILEAGLEAQAKEIEAAERDVPTEGAQPSAPVPGRPLLPHEERQLEIQKYEQQHQTQTKLGAQTSAQRLAALGLTVESNR